MFNKWLIIFVVFLSSCSVAQPEQPIAKNEPNEIDQFVIQHLNKVQPISIENNIEYCGLIVRNSEGVLSATQARPGQEDSCELEEWISADVTVVASYHTHGAYNRYADAEVPSIDDLIGDFEEGIDGYISTPSGRVWLNDADEEKSYLLCGLGCVYIDPNFVECQAFLSKKVYTIETLEHRAQNDVGEC